MMERKGILLGALVLALLVILGASLALAQTPKLGDSRLGTQLELALQDTVGTAFTYQGQLSSEGSPVDQYLDFRFRLYDASTDGNWLATYYEHDIWVTDGFLTVDIDFGNVFTGGPCYLEVSCVQESVQARTPGP